MRSDSLPTVSVIVPIYKVERYLSRCIESICAQSYPALEILLVDDGSPDGCPAICEAYARKDERICVIHKENGGLSSARNAGMRRASGEYFCFVDSDDYILPDMIEQLFITARHSQAQVSVCAFSDDERQLDRGITEEYKIYSSEEALREILLDRDFCTTACAKLYERELFDQISFPEGRIYEDYATVYQVIHKAGRIAYADTRKYFYTVNTAGITKSGFSPRQMDYFTVSDEVEAFIGEHYPKLKKLVRDRAENMAISLFLRLALSPERERFREEEKRLTAIIRRDALPFLSGGYPMSKKLSGLAVSAAPRISGRLLAAIFSGQ